MYTIKDVTQDTRINKEQITDPLLEYESEFFKVIPGCKANSHTEATRKQMLINDVEALAFLLPMEKAIKNGNAVWRSFLLN